jgi:hypothetical protein
MTLGFIRFVARNHADKHDHTEPSNVGDQWPDWQIAEAWELYTEMRYVHHKLFKEVKRYFERLAVIDPDYRPAELQVAEVVLRLSSIGTIRERLEFLTVIARRLRDVLAQRGALRP